MTDVRGVFWKQVTDRNGLELVHYQSRGDVAVLVVDNPPVNALSPGVPEAIGAGITRANEDSRVGAIVIVGAGRTFMAGADIHEFQEPKNVDHYLSSLHLCARLIEDSVKPVVMAIHGAAFGAGLETAMAGHYRLMVSNAQVGQPEVKLGLIPGSGGTQRLPRLVGPAKAAEMCALGDALSAQQALDCGLTDRVVEAGIDLVTEACYFARQAKDLPIVKTRDRRDRIENIAVGVLHNARAVAKHKFPGQTAPLLAIEAVEASIGEPFHKGLHYEGHLFRECLESPQSRALIYLFFAERAAARVPDIPVDTRPLASLQAAQVMIATEPGGQLKDDDVICIERDSSRLVEIVRGPQADSERVKTAMDWAKKQGRLGVVVRDFVSQRLRMRMSSEIESLVGEGHQRAVIESALGGFGVTGFTAGEDAASADQIIKRVTQALADEGAAMVQQGKVIRESDVDVIATLACGFPAWRGGPLFYAKQIIKD